MFVKLNYATTVVASATSALVDRVYSGNGLFDPDITGVGHQPLGFDQWMGIYIIYRVHASSIKVTALNNGTASATFLNVAIFPSGDSTAMASDEQGEEQPDAMDDTAGVSTGPSEDRFYKYCTSTQILGVKDIAYSPAYAGDASSNPSGQWYWRIIVGNSNGANVNCVLNINIQYTVEFYRPKILVQS